jgi:hypothetical protein
MTTSNGVIHKVTTIPPTILETKVFSKGLLAKVWNNNEQQIVARTPWLNYKYYRNQVYNQLHGFLGRRFQRGNRGTSSCPTFFLERNWRLFMSTGYVYQYVTESFTSLLLDVQTTLIYLSYLTLRNSDRCICVHVTQRNLQSSLSQPFWKANHGNYVPHNQQITLTTDCVHNTTDPRLAASISAVYATHTPSEADIYPILDSLLCVQYLCSN